ncbi:MAG: kelch motif-containing protein [Cyclobacteriaceae bacterium]|nr:kelch motif-containing protein [Cyclobacteriaceae bacterium]
MRNISLIIIVLLLIPDLVLSQTPIFTWKSGSENSNQATSMYVSPGARDNACSWTDANGDLWLFGGEGLDINGSLGLLNDLWKFDASRWRWEKLSGATNIDIKGTYGTLGISSSNNVPGARKGAIAWIDADNNLWLFGGEGIDDNNSKGQLNDLWKYNPITEEWTWIDGSKLRNQEGNYNGLYGTSKIPGGRKSSCAWTDNSGNFWLFGGYGYDKYAYLGFLNDIWKYNTSTNEWTHEKGSTDANLKGNYGTLNVSNLSNTPGSRDNAITWVDANNNFLMYSGYGYDGSSNLGYLNDLWKYNPATKEWVWISGNNQRNVSGVYGVKEVSSTTNLPGSRRNATSWLDNSGNLLIFGGYGYDFEGSLGYLGDLWKYNIVTEEWVWLSGADIVNSTGKYGTLGFGDWNNNAGSREGAVAWKDTNGDYFLFGGKGYDGTQSFGLLNDLWALYDNLKWLWAAGSSSKDEIGFYGKGTINNTYSPGSKEYHMTWADSKNRLWVFGGQTSNLYRYLRRLNDLWYYDIELDTWVWVSGDIIDSQPGNYGIKGVENKTNYPGGRTNSVTWIDSKGNLWLFGGQGNDKDGNYGELNDLWKFNTNTQNWIWVSGSNIINDLGNFGTKGIESPDNLPSSRSYAISWVIQKIISGCLAEMILMLFGNLIQKLVIGHGYQEAKMRKIQETTVIWE